MPDRGNDEVKIVNVAMRQCPRAQGDEYEWTRNASVGQSRPSKKGPTNMWEGKCSVGRNTCVHLITPYQWPGLGPSMAHTMSANC